MITIACTKGRVNVDQADLVKNRFIRSINIMFDTNFGITNNAIKDYASRFFDLDEKPVGVKKRVTYWVTEA